MQVVDDNVNGASKHEWIRQSEEMAAYAKKNQDYYWTVMLIYNRDIRYPVVNGLIVFGVWRAILKKPHSITGGIATAVFTHGINMWPLIKRYIANDIAIKDADDEVRRRKWRARCM